ncbi:MAG: MurR/RpiR family transcriptional regulator [Anaerolineales bacterium]|nr:MurR/RpiR family transcriptional regulator [Anaerolineales bacterium]
MDSLFEDRIRQHRNNFPPSFQSLGKFLLDSYPQAALMTATELAHVLDLDPGTVVRFSQKLGYKGYLELQKDLRRKLKDELLHIPSHAENDSNPADAAFSAAARCLELTRRSFSLQAAEQIIDTLDRCERILLLAEGMAVPAAQNLAFWLSAAGYTIQTAGDNPVEIARLLTGAHPRDLVAAVEVSPNSPFLLRAMTAAKEAELKTAAIIAAPSSRLADFAENVLAGYGNPGPGFQQMMVETIVHIFIQILRQARPLRFKSSSEKFSKLSKQLITGETNF